MTAFIWARNVRAVPYYDTLPELLRGGYTPTSADCMMMMNDLNHDNRLSSGNNPNTRRCPPFINAVPKALVVSVTLLRPPPKTVPSVRFY